jgi:hypothetical protein
MLSEIINDLRTVDNPTVGVASLIERRESELRGCRLRADIVGRKLYAAQNDLDPRAFDEMSETLYQLWRADQ